LRGVQMVMLASGLPRRRDAEAVGICAYLTKPARRSFLYDALVTAASAAGSGEGGPGAEPSTTPAQPAPLHGAPILVVEDNPVNQAVAEGMLARRGHPVDIAQNGREAVEAVSQGRYAAVLMDCQMPEMDGYQATAEIRRREGEGPRIPIIAMTAHSMQGDRERCLAAGMDDHLPKPLRGDALDSALSRWLPAPSPGADPSDSAAPAGSAEDDLIDVEVIERLRSELGGLGRATALDAVVREFLEGMPDRVAAIAGAVERGEDDDVSQEAHALRGASSNFGAKRLANICSDLEQRGGEGDLEHARTLLPDLEQAAALTRAALERWLEKPEALEPAEPRR